VSQPFVSQRRRLMPTYGNGRPVPSQRPEHPAARPPQPSPHPEARKLVAAAAALLRQQQAACAGPSSDPFQPETEILAAALHVRDLDPAALLAALEGWILQARALHSAPATQSETAAPNPA
jgi:hypothetical protein